MDGWIGGWVGGLLPAGPRARELACQASLSRLPLRRSRGCGRKEQSLQSGQQRRRRRARARVFSSVPLEDGEEKPNLARRAGPQLLPLRLASLFFRRLRGSDS